MEEIKEMENEERRIKKKEKKGINVFLLLFSVMVVAAIFSYILPAGNFAREMVDGREVVVQGSYKVVESTPISFFELFTAIPQAMGEAGPIIIYIIIIGGMFGVINSTGAIDALLITATKKLANKEFLFIAITMFLFSVGGSVIGMAEESLIYIPIVVPIVLAMGYDVITGAAIVLFGMGIGFTTAVLNPFTIGVAQSIAGLPMFSGLGVRLLVYVLMYTLTVTFVYRYAQRVKKDPSRGFFVEGKYDIPDAERVGATKFETKHKLVLIAFLIAICTMVFGTIKFGWYLSEMSAVFIILTIVVSIIAKLSPDKLMKAFSDGSSGIIMGVLVIGLARGIVVILTNANIIDTILYYSSNVLHEAPSSLVSACMFLVQAIIHFLVPSGSGQAMLTMPIMVPLADLLGVTRQTACLVFSLADGLGNTIFPTVGYFMAALAIAGIPWQKWAIRVLPLVLMQYGLAIVVVVIANMMHYGPF